MNPTAMIFGRLLEAGLDLEQFDGADAIFSERAPDAFLMDDAGGYRTIAKSFVVIAAPTQDQDTDTFSSEERAIQQDVRLYGPDLGSTAVIDAQARTVRGLFHNQEAALIGANGKVVVSTVTGPVGAPTENPALVGRRLTLRLQMTEN